MQLFNKLWNRHGVRRRPRALSRTGHSTLGVESLGVDLLEQRQVMTAAPYANVAALDATVLLMTATVSNAELATTPTAPTNLVVNAGNGQVRLTWSAPSSNGGSSVTDYIVQCSTDWGRSWTVYQDGQSADMSTTVSRLPNDVTYVFRVSAVNAAGVGAGASVWATPSAAHDFQYTRNPAGITITKYKGTSTEVTVPQFINGLRVTELGIGAFQGRGDITRVTLPQGLLKIGNNAFDGCGNLVSVNIPNGVTSIGDTAFIWCGKLQTLNIPASVTSIGIFWSFWGCSSLKSFNVDPANTKYASQDGILYNKDKTWLYWCPGGKSGEVSLPSTVKTIGYFSFHECRGITKLTIPASVTLIEDGAFNGCANLRSFYFLGNAPTVRATFDPRVAATAYYVRGTTGWGPTLGGIPTATTPLAPSIRMSIVGPGTVTIPWSSPTSDGGTAITGYVVTISTAGGKIIRQELLDAKSRFYRATRLLNGVQYTFRVAAMNAAGVGAWSSPVVFTPRQPIFGIK
jgi:hypothetical protein